MIQDSDRTSCPHLYSGPFCMMIGQLDWEKAGLIRALYQSNIWRLCSAVKRLRSGAPKNFTENLYLGESCMMISFLWTCLHSEHSRIAKTPYVYCFNISSLVADFFPQFYHRSVQYVTSLVKILTSGSVLKKRKKTNRKINWISCCIFGAPALRQF